MRLFGFEIKRPEEKDVVSFAEPTNGDGALTVGNAVGGSYNMIMDIEGAAKSEAELITRYRQMMKNPEIQQAVDEIVNETLSIDTHDKVVNIILDDTKLPEKIKKIIIEEFDGILSLLDFSNNGYEIVSKFYVDGRLNFHAIIDKDNPKSGIKELRYLDPRKVRLIREMEDDKTRSAIESLTLKKIKKEYFMYSENGFGTTSGDSYYGGSGISGVQISKDSIVRITSGILNENNTVVLSYLDPAFKPLNQLRILEDSTVIYTLTRAPERRIFYVDVGNLTKAKAEQYLYDMMAKHKNRVTYDSSTGEMRDDRKMMCYAMDTKIPLLDGRTLPLLDIIKEHNEGKQNWVYSCDPITGKFYPGPVSWAGVTKNNAEVVRVTFDNGKEVVCTPDHKFPVWGKGFVEAQRLTREDSIVPGYRRQAEITKGGPKYEQIYKNDTQTWEYTHREVSKWKEENDISEEMTHDQKYYNSQKTVIHHKNFNGLDNTPTNLVKMNHKDHLNYHRDIQKILYNSELIEAVEICARNGFSKSQTVKFINFSDVIEKWADINRNRNPKNRSVNPIVFTSNDLTRITKLSGFKSWSKYCVNYETVKRENNGRRKRGSLTKWSPEYNQMLSDTRKNKVSFSKTWKVTDPTGKSEIIENLSAYCKKLNLNRSNIKGKFGSRGYKAEILRNHRILSVEFLDEKIDVGSMTIDRDETYHSHHTYLIDAGVYTKNTMTEDYWFPRREGNRSTEVDTLPSGTGLGQNENLPYFQNKLYKSLNVPVARLQPETMYSFGRPSEVTRDELKFAKFIRRFRAKFSVLFDRCLERQLILKAIMTIEEWEETKNKIRYDFMKDNFFEELKETEILRERLQTISTMDPMIGKYFSEAWVKKNIMKQTDEEIEKMSEEISEERERDATNENPDQQDTTDKQDNKEEQK